MKSHEIYAENHRILSHLVEREVICNLCQTMQMYQEHNIDSFLEEFCHYDYEQSARNNWWMPVDEIDDEKILSRDAEQIEDSYFFNTDSGEYSEIEDWQELCEENRIDADPIEIYEFWHVSGFLADTLREHDQIVVDCLDFNVWGRCTTGQAISLDAVIARIAWDMEICKGQANEWTHVL